MSCGNNGNYEVKSIKCHEWCLRINKVLIKQVYLIKFRKGEKNFKMKSCSKLP